MKHGLDTGFLVAAEVLEHADHLAARKKISDLTAAGDTFALASQVLAEFIHVVTDSKRFAKPLTVSTARTHAEKWWTAREISQVTCEAAAVAQFFIWHRDHNLGRKRLLDTLLAATYHTAGINSLLTTNAADFTILGGFQCITP